MVSMVSMIIGRFFFVSVVGRAIGMDMTVFARFMALMRFGTMCVAFTRFAAAGDHEAKSGGQGESKVGIRVHLHWLLSFICAKGSGETSRARHGSAS